MPHVVTQSCVGDGSCVYACPVNCIQPTPDDPEFELAEMLHIDPVSCVDCGACVAACPVDAIKPHSRLDDHERAFALINAAYHRVPRKRSLLAPVRPPLVVRDRGESLRVAIVGSGPAAMYAAEELLTVPDARVSVFERLPSPDGLVRSGVAPDHRRTRRVSRQLDQIRRHPGLTMHLGVEVGRDVTHAQLLETHHAVIYAVGAASDRRLDVPGADTPGVLSATELVGWYNGHPDHADRTVDLSHRRAVVVGNGNVALDIARILTTDPEALAETDISPVALEALRASRVEELVVVGRRGPAHSAFTLPELIGLQATPGVRVGVDPEALAGLTAEAPSSAPNPKLALLRSFGPPASDGRRITLRYGLAVAEIHGDDAVEAVSFTRAGRRSNSGAPDGSAAHTTDADEVEWAETDNVDRPETTRVTAEVEDERIETGLVVASIGYRGLPVAGLPFDPVTGTVPNDGGRVVDPTTADPATGVPGSYVVGWIKRGPSGFIGTNKGCSQDTVVALIEDYNAGRLPSPRRDHGRPYRSATLA